MLEYSSTNVRRTQGDLSMLLVNQPFSEHKFTPNNRMLELGTVDGVTYYKLDMVVGRPKGGGSFLYCIHGDWDRTTAGRLLQMQQILQVQQDQIELLARRSEAQTSKLEAADSELKQARRQQEQIEQLLDQNDRLREEIAALNAQLAALNAQLAAMSRDLDSARDLLASRSQQQQEGPLPFEVITSEVNHGSLTCPHCDKPFANQRGLNVHIARSHQGVAELAREAAA